MNLRCSYISHDFPSHPMHVGSGNCYRKGKNRKPEKLSNRMKQVKFVEHSGRNSEIVFDVLEQFGAQYRQHQTAFISILYSSCRCIRCLRCIQFCQHVSSDSPGCTLRHFVPIFRHVAEPSRSASLSYSSDLRHRGQTLK